MWVCDHGNMDIVKELVDGGADLEIRDNVSYDMNLIVFGIII